MTIVEQPHPQSQARSDSQRAIGEIVFPDRVHGSAYTSQDVFEEEIDRIFSEGWVYVAHESEIPTEGDYVTRKMGRQPVIVSRAKDGEVHVMANRCAHRGNRLCNADAGNSSSFKCPYHGWVFANDGSLTAIPMKQALGDRHDQVRAELSLANCERVDSYGGFIFASFAAQGITLLEHLGGATSAIDRLNNLSPTGRIQLTAGWMKHHQLCNWKMVIENNVDGYHALFTHQSMYEAVRPAKVSHQPTKVDVIVRDMGMGHSEIDYAEEYLKLNEEFVWFGRIQPSKLPKYLDAMRTEYGEERTHHALVVGPPHTLIFPNLFLAEMNIMTVEPIGPGESIAYTTAALIPGQEEMNSRILRRCEGAMGPSGFLIADDGEIAARNQLGLAAKNPEWVTLNRGFESELTNETGILSYDKSAETPQRGFWRHWGDVMGARGSAAPIRSRPVQVARESQDV
jgi:phenylpropionate dioxygenase-like ring-hydroxylating dioxygenase large terminal subunit